MAITKMMNIKQAKKGSASAHLFNAINYILNEKKTENGLWVGGNAGTIPADIYDTFIDTKRSWAKLEGRQGYHYVISFRPGEVDEEKAYAVVKEFCEKYLQDDFDYVFAIHNDQDHMHGHIIFNSVNRMSGYKYRYIDGDWEKFIQPITDSICKKYGIEPLTYEKSNKKGKSYGQWEAEKKGKPIWKKVIQADVDYALSISESDVDFINKMKEFGYKVHVGTSEKYGKYYSFTAPGQSRAWRNYKLGSGYDYEDMMNRLGQKNELYSIAQTPRMRKVKMQGNYIFTNQFLKVQVRKLYVVSYGKFRLVSLDNQKQSEIRKSVLNIDRMRRQIQYMYRSGLNSLSALEKREKELYILEQQLKSKMKIYNNLEKDSKFQEYKQLKEKIMAATDNEFEDMLDRLEFLRKELPLIEDIPQNLKSVREEKRLIKGIKNDSPFIMSWRKYVPTVGTKKERAIKCEQPKL